MSRADNDPHIRRFVDAIGSMTLKLKMTMSGASRIHFPHVAANAVIEDVKEILSFIHYDVSSNQLCLKLNRALTVAGYLVSVGKKENGIQAFSNALETIVDIIVDHEERIKLLGEEIKMLESKIVRLEAHVAAYLLPVVEVPVVEGVVLDSPASVSGTDFFSSTITYADICQNPNFIHGYLSEKDSELFYVVIWNGDCPATKLVTDVPPVGSSATIHFVDVTIVHDVRLSEVQWRFLEVQRQFIADNELVRSELSAAEFVISRNVKRLFQSHSNLVAVQTEWTRQGAAVRLFVSCKGFVPVNEDPLPKTINLLKTHVCQGWLRSCSGGGLRPHDNVSPGCAIAPASFSCMGDTFPEPTFGTLGGYVTARGATFAVTVGHLFYDHNDQRTLAPGENVVASPALARLLLRIADEGETGMYNKYCSLFGSGAAISKIVKRLQLTDADIFELNNCVSTGTGNLGQLEGCLYGEPLMKLDNMGQKVAVDVGVVRVGAPFPFVDLDRQYEELAAIPSLCVHLDDTTLEPDVTLATSMRGLTAHGYGARSSLDLSLSFAEDSVTWVRSSREETEVIYKCFSGCGSGVTVLQGDSGTWFWREDGALVGMVIGTMSGYAMILPMSDVLQAVREIAFPFPGHGMEEPESTNI